VKEVLETYRQYLDRQPVSAHTRRNYMHRVNRYLDYLENSVEGLRALSDEVERDFQLREFKAWLLTSGASPSTVNSILSAVDNFYLSRGMKPAKLKRLDLPMQAPRALEQDEERRLLKALVRASLRNRAVATIMMHAGLRISEVSALNVGDVSLTARRGEILVRCGKGLKQRTIPINQDLREVLQKYLAGEASREALEPLFVSQKKNRLSMAAIDKVVRSLGAEACLELSAHDLRHHFITRLVRQGTDIVTVAELAGHARLETVRRYSLPTAAVKQQALEKLCGYAS